MPSAAIDHRPAHPRHPLNLRMPEKLRVKLERAAQASGQSLTKEATSRLASSFTHDDAFGGPELGQLVMAMASALALGGQYAAGPGVAPKDWLREPAACIAGMTTVLDTMIVLMHLSDEDAVLAVESIKSRIATRIATRAQSDE